VNVLFLTHRLPFAPNRGDRIRAYHMLKFLRPHARVEVLSLVHDAEEASQVSSVPADLVRVVRATPWRNRARALFALSTDAPLTHVLLNAPSLRREFLDAVARSRPDVVIAYCTGLARLVMDPVLAGVPVLLDMVDVDSAKWAALGSASSAPMSWIYRREAKRMEAFEEQIVRYARATTVVAERERETLVHIAPAADVHVVSNGIDLDSFRNPGPPATGRTVVFCGIMNYQPNEEAAVRLGRSIWPAVRARFPDSRLVIVGAYPTPLVRRLAADDPSIVVTGAVPHVQPYLWSAAVSVAPIATARGVQNKVLEALAAGLPVVTSTAVADGLPPEVQPGCMVARSDDEAAAAIGTLLGLPPDERRSFALRARLDELSWARQLHPLLQLLSAAQRAAAN
jgi:sugar transferase (PEP-CTERM/EpsH1 system associated)